jgi:hypothetical protein
MMRWEACKRSYASIDAKAWDAYQCARHAWRSRIERRSAAARLPRLRHHIPFPYGIADTAAAAGNVKMLRWLKQRGCALTSSTSYAAAARPDNIPVLQLSLESGCYCDLRVCSAACTAGDLAQLQWLHEHGAELAPAVAVQAAAAGRADMRGSKKQAFL